MEFRITKRNCGWFRLQWFSLLSLGLFCAEVSQHHQSSLLKSGSENCDIITQHLKQNVVTTQWSHRCVHLSTPDSWANVITGSPAELMTSKILIRRYTFWEELCNCILLYSIRNLGLFLTGIGLYWHTQGGEHGGKGKNRLGNAWFPNCDQGMQMQVSYKQQMLLSWIGSVSLMTSTLFPILF